MCENRQHSRPQEPSSKALGEEKGTKKKQKEKSFCLKGPKIGRLKVVPPRVGLENTLQLANLQPDFVPPINLQPVNP
jgi:hypothetical protein